jgi:hypothetical protein
MVGRILDRMVERSIPPFAADDENRRLVEEAAENGIRLTLRVVGIACVILIVASAAVFFKFSPGFPAIWRLPEIVRSSGQPGRTEAPGGKEAMLRQALEDADKMRDDASKDSQKQLEETKQESEKKLNAMTKDRDALQAKVNDLEQRVTELTTKLQARADRDLPAPRQASQPSARAAAPAGAAVLAIPRPNSYVCGDGRVLRNPTGCRPAHEPAAVDVATPRTSFQCGDGRVVRDPVLCKPG